MKGGCLRSQKGMCGKGLRKLLSWMAQTGYGWNGERILRRHEGNMRQGTQETIVLDATNNSNTPARKGKRNALINAFV